MLTCSARLFCSLNNISSSQTFRHIAYLVNMEESSLDDFFAKKDRSKKKSKAFSKAAATNDDVDDASKPGKAKQEDEMKVLKKKKPKEKNDDVADPSSSTNNKTEQRKEEEWNDFEQEKETDYSTLRIQNLQISTREEEEQEREDGEDGEEGDQESGAAGVWRKGGGASQPASVPDPVVEVVEPPPPPPAPVDEPKTSGRYVPPSMRGQRDSGGAGTTGSYTSHSMYRRKKVAPNIESEEDFPTLGTHAIDIDGYGGATFERVRGGAGCRPEETKTIRLELGNKFDALARSDS